MNKEPILTDEEREYLKVVCKPFKDRIRGIGVRKCLKIEGSNKEQLVIFTVSKFETIMLSFFEKNTMYKKLKRKTIYSLEDLGITYE